MEKSRYSKVNLILAILCVLLAVATSFVYTYAFFGSSEESDATISMAGPVVVRVADNTGQIANGGTLDFDLPTSVIIPGSTMKPSISAVIVETTTTAVMRAKFGVVVTGVSQAHKDDFESSLTSQILGVIDSGWAYNAGDDWFYFLGSSESDSGVVQVMNTPAESSGLTVPEFGNTYADYDNPYDRTLEADPLNTVLASIKADSGNVTIPFLIQDFVIPFHLTTVFSEAEVHFTFTVEALQDYVVNLAGTENVLPTVGAFQEVAYI